MDDIRWENCEEGIECPTCGFTVQDEEDLLDCDHGILITEHICTNCSTKVRVEGKIIFKISEILEVGNE